MLWRLGRHFGPRKNAQKLGLPYDYLQATEHVNAIFNLKVFIQHHFENIVEKWYPARIPFAGLESFLHLPHQNKLELVRRKRS